MPRDRDDESGRYKKSYTPDMVLGVIEDHGGRRAHRRYRTRSDPLDGSPSCAFGNSKATTNPPIRTRSVVFEASTCTDISPRHRTTNETECYGYSRGNL